MSNALDMDKSQIEKEGKFNTGDNVNFLLTNPTILIKHPQDMTKWHFCSFFSPWPIKTYFKRDQQRKCRTSNPSTWKHIHLGSGGVPQCLILTKPSSAMTSGWEVLIPEFQNKLFFALREKYGILSDNEYCQKRGSFCSSVFRLVYLDDSLQVNIPVSVFNRTGFSTVFSLCVIRICLL